MYRAVGLVPAAFVEAPFNEATAYDYVYSWNGTAWVLEREGWVTEMNLVADGGRILDRRPYDDLLHLKPPPYRAVVRYYFAERAGKRFWQRLGVDTNYRT
jgi:hypothetical protein